ncbi:hypothetical protein P3T36_003033 [Kitasatospora sp. MAP12-15]|jgi:hypothetical protein|uniref:DUF2630 family protein n=1 Tax=unclassified Kitasatospora TaxID=2633591 RepID=UPI002473F75C|nr:DUF2630 family protein [Kitasatospora sp. MAP12-44]MDH6110664.1 hypothetical protein [Kitasatospora sp. MAP12-44]
MAGEQNNDILGSIDRLVDAEKQLRARIADGSADSDAARQELAALEVQLDQCWDLLRQRRARTEFGEDPGTARVRPAEEVEGYES